ncbi:MAG: hypothetical protein AAGJ97_12840 [Planctomycetota bacterium]
MFDFSVAMDRLCRDISERVDDFAHVDMNRVAVTFAQTRRRVLHGMQAKLTPLRFAGGAEQEVRHGRRYGVERVRVGGREMLYILTFYLPRFCEHPFREKLVTVFHELYHISPAFDGDVRRFGGRYSVHTGSQKNYDAAMAVYADAYMRDRPPAAVVDFLRHDFAGLRRTAGTIVGLQLPIPKLVPLDDAA